MCDLLCHTIASMMRFFFFLRFYFVSLWGKVARTEEGWGDKWDWDAHKIHKGAIKSFKKNILTQSLYFYYSQTA